MSLNAYLKMNSNGVDIKGSAQHRVCKEWIEVLAANHEVVKTEDISQITDKRQHKPFVIIKMLDKSSPLLYKSLVENEQIGRWELQLWQPDPRGRGTEVNYYTVILEKAKIAGIEFEMPDKRYNEDNAWRNRVYEKVSFIYERIGWTWEDGEITANDIIGNNVQ